MLPLSGGHLTEPGRRDRARRLDRSRARAWILQIHYKWESEGRKTTLLDALADTVTTRRISPRRLPYVEQVITLMNEHLSDIDEALGWALDNWRLDRLTTIARAVLRIGGVEMLFVDAVPPKVAIQEAILLAEMYGGEESPRFVNGVLDALFKKFTS